MLILAISLIIYEVCVRALKDKHTAYPQDVKHMPHEGNFNEFWTIIDANAITHANITTNTIKNDPLYSLFIIHCHSSTWRDLKSHNILRSAFRQDVWSLMPASPELFNSV